VVALVLVLGPAIGGGGGDGGGDTRSGKAETAEPTTTEETLSDPPKPPPKRAYIVVAGDNLDRIAEKTGVPVETLQDLNPDVDPQALVIGEKIMLRE